uniref:Uncharacterized protein n=1 Tax=Romanomermis culicivorax TaxID=13658 RepID=A0A915KH57_ROMCU
MKSRQHIVLTFEILPLPSTASVSPAKILLDVLTATSTHFFERRGLPKGDAVCPCCCCCTDKSC